jgi:hypothetical protein
VVREIATRATATTMVVHLPGVNSDAISGVVSGVNSGVISGVNSGVISGVIRDIK